MGSFWSTPNPNSSVTYYPTSGDEPGNLNYISSGSSSYSDGTQEGTGAHMYSNINGQVHHENLQPGQGYFHSVSQQFPNPALSSATFALVVSAAVVILMLAVVIVRRRKMFTGRTVIATADVEAQPHRQQAFSVPFMFPQKRPFAAAAMRNADLLMEEEMVEIKLNRSD